MSIPRETVKSSGSLNRTVRLLIDLRNIKVDTIVQKVDVFSLVRSQRFEWRLARIEKYVDLDIGAGHMDKFVPCQDRGHPTGAQVESIGTS